MDLNPSSHCAVITYSIDNFYEGNPVNLHFPPLSRAPGEFSPQAEVSLTKIAIKGSLKADDQVHLSLNFIDPKTHGKMKVLTVLTPQYIYIYGWNNL